MHAKAIALPPLEGRLTIAADFGGTPPSQAMWMPAGRHEISCSRGGDPVQVTVLVDRQTAVTVQAALEAHLAASPQRPYFDLDHQKANASGWPTEFFWSDSPAPGVYAKVEWSRAGAQAISGKEYRAFSPCFLVDDEQKKPARVSGAPLNMGGLVNEPAFRKILPLWAKNTLGARTQMNEESVTLEALQAENAELRSAIQARQKADAEAAVEAACRRGVIPPKAAHIRARWLARLEANPEDAELLAAMPAHPALTPITRPEGVRVQVLREDIANVCKGYLEAKTPRDRGLIYQADINPRLEKGEIIPFADFADRLPFEASNTLGTLVSDIISQRTLATLVSKRPMLKGVCTDFADTAMSLNQKVIVRTIGLPAVENFGAAATERSDTDYEVTLSAFKQVLFTLLATEYNATARNLVAEQSDALAVALGNHLVEALAALMDDTFTEETVTSSVNFTYGVISGITKAMNILGVADYDRFGWVNSAVAEALREDQLMNENYDRDSGAAYSHWRNVEGFQDIWEYPTLPTNSVNLNGFFFQRNALLMAVRPPANPALLSGANYPGILRIISDPVSGFSVMSNRWIDPASLAINDRLLILYGVDEGVLNAAHKTVTA